MNLVYCIDNKLGGITSFNQNIINSASHLDATQFVICIDQEEWTYTRADASFNADKELSLKYSAKDNLYSVVDRFHKLLPHVQGAIILNDCLEMQMLDHYPVNLTRYQIVHDEYNLLLAVQYGHVVDVFIAHSYYFYEKLISALPERSENIFFLPHGVSIPEKYRSAHKPDSPIKLLFLGRMAKRKGIFDLPEIDRLLCEWNVPHSWTCVGSGPDLKELQEIWKPRNTSVEFLSPDTNEEVRVICAEHDVFVLPTQFEGSPVSLLETMSAGLVPVITDLPGGIREIVGLEIGFRIPMGDTNGFAKAIKELHGDRERLLKFGKACREKIISEFNVRDTAARYHQLFSRYQEFKRPAKIEKHKIGSRLDQTWIPSAITRTLRSF